MDQKEDAACINISEVSLFATTNATKVGKEISIREKRKQRENSTNFILSA